MKWLFTSLFLGYFLTANASYAGYFIRNASVEQIWVFDATNASLIGSLGGDSPYPLDISRFPIIISACSSLVCDVRALEIKNPGCYIILYVGQYFAASLPCSAPAKSKNPPQQPSKPAPMKK